MTPSFALNLNPIPLNASSEKPEWSLYPKTSISISSPILTVVHRTALYADSCPDPPAPNGTFQLTTLCIPVQALSILPKTWSRPSSTGKRSGGTLTAWVRHPQRQTDRAINQPCQFSTTLGMGCAGFLA